MKYLIHCNNVSFVALLETQISGAQADVVCRKLGLSSFRVEARGRRGGIWLLWDDSLSVKVLATQPQYLHFEARYQRHAPSLVTIVYALPPVSGMENYWREIASFDPGPQVPWLVAGDFNSITDLRERKGGSGGLRPHDRRFSDWIQSNSFIDLGFSGSHYTWMRGRETSHRVFKRLDRALCNQAWRHQWMEGSVRHLARYQSDHNPLLITFSDEDRGNRGRRPFRFQAIWCTHPSFIRLLQAKWNHSSELIEALETFKHELVTWNSEVFGNVEKRKRRLWARLEGIQAVFAKSPNSGLAKLEEKVRSELDLALQQEELLWLQKSREKWIVQGDRNTRFFHTTTLVRRRRNKVEALLDEENVWITEARPLEDHALSFFKNLYQAEDHVAVQSMPTGLFVDWTNEDSARASRPITEKEVRESLKEMGPLKAPGVDGFQAVFYQKYWNVVKSPLLEFIKKAFESGRIPEKFNETLLVLLPKVLSPERISQFRPISLCNVPYKLLTKLIVNRIKAKLPQLVSPLQGSFVPDRSISDNVVILQEVLHSMRGKRSGKGWMAIKIDLEKAYDRVDWRFLEATLFDVGFPSQLTKLIMACVEGASTSLLWNGEITQSFKPSRGLRQGDPMSPYLFVLCMEKLAHWIMVSVARKEWKPICLVRGGPPLSHLFFADDILLFAEAKADQAEVIQRGLAEFSAASGQKVSGSKSRVYFSNNVLPELATSLCSKLGIPLTRDLGKYLGVPALHGRVNKETYGYLVDRVQAKLAGWKAKQLTMAGRITLVRSVLATIPTYTMQTVHLPAAICDSLDKLNRGFIWGDTEEKRKIHLVRWEDICKPRREGGLGLRRAREMNKSLLVKLGWRFLKETNAFWVKILETKYCRNGQRGFVSIPNQKKSITWASLVRVAETLSKGLGWSVGNGKSIDFWLDSWLSGGGRLAGVVSAIPAEERGKKVADYWDPSVGWDWPKLRGLLPVEWWPRVEAQFVDSAPDAIDVLAWRKAANGMFSTKSAYLMLISSQIAAEASGVVWRRLWCLKVPEKIKVFLWKCLKGKLLCNQERFRRKLASDPLCVVCGGRPESLLHLLRDCPKVRKFWRTLVPQAGHLIFFSLNFRDWLEHNIELSEEFVGGVEWCNLFAISCWWVWRWRNDVSFETGSFLAYKVELPLRLTREAKLAWGATGDREVSVRATREIMIAWNPPKQGWVKLNTDGAAKGNPGLAGGGGVIRDWLGAWCVGFVNNTGECNSLASELWAMWRGLSLAWSRRYPRIVVETDSVVVASCLAEGIAEEHPLSSLVKNCRDLISRDWQVEVRWGYREENQVADWLSNYALLFPLGFYIIEAPPAECAQFLMFDSSGVGTPRNVSLVM